MVRILCCIWLIWGGCDVWLRWLCVKLVGVVCCWMGMGLGLLCIVVLCCIWLWCVRCRLMWMVRFWCCVLILWLIVGCRLIWNGCVCSLRVWWWWGLVLCCMVRLCLRMVIWSRVILMVFRCWEWMRCCVKFVCIWWCLMILWCCLVGLVNWVCCLLCWCWLMWFLWWLVCVFVVCWWLISLWNCRLVDVIFVLCWVVLCGLVCIDFLNKECDVVLFDVSVK